MMCRSASLCVMSTAVCVFFPIYLCDVYHIAGQLLVLWLRKSLKENTRLCLKMLSER